MPGMSLSDLLNLRGIIPRPTITLPPVPGQTYFPQPVNDVRPIRLPLNGVITFGLEDLYFWATLARSVYFTDDQFIQRTAAALKAPTVVNFVANSTSSEYGYAIIRYEDGAILVVSGTSNTLQTTRQFLAHLGDFQLAPGGYETNRHWLDAAAPIVAALTPYLASDTPLLAIGHSAGGAVAANVLLQFAGAQVDNQFSLVTFGSPAFFSVAMQMFASHVAQLRVVGVNDPVPYLPFPTSFGYVASATSPVFAVRPRSYRHATVPFVLTGSNRPRYAAINEQDVGTWLGQATMFLLGDESAQELHSMRRYAEYCGAAAPAAWEDYIQGWANYPDLSAVNEQLTLLNF